MPRLAEDQYCNCAICSSMVDCKMIYQDDVEYEMTRIAEAHPDAFANALHSILWEGKHSYLNRVKRHAEGEAMRINHKLRVKTSHNTDKDGNVTVVFEIPLPKFIDENYGCSPGQVRKEIKRHGGSQLSAYINQLSFDEVPATDKGDPAEDKTY